MLYSDDARVRELTGYRVHAAAAGNQAGRLDEALARLIRGLA